METFLKTWSVMRIARLVLAIVAFSMSVSQHEPMFAFLGGILLMQAVFNVSCCAGGACAALPPKRSFKSNSKFKDGATIEEIE